MLSFKTADQPDDRSRTRPTSTLMRSLAVRLALSLPIALQVSGCGLFRSDLADGARDHGIEERTLVELTATEGIGMRRSGDEIELVRLVPDGGTWEESVLATGPRMETVTVQFAATESESADPRSYLFGNVGAHAARVEVELRPADNGDEGVKVEGGIVGGGLWLVVIHASAADPSTITWRMLDQDGEVVEAGTGPTS